MKAKKNTSKKSSDQSTANIVIRLFGGDRQSVDANFKSAVRIIDGHQTPLAWKSLKGGEVTYNVPFHDNLFDNYTVLVTSDDHVDAGFFPVKVDPDVDQYVDLMLLADRSSFKFVDWNRISASFPSVHNFLCCDCSDSEAQKRYEDLAKAKPQAAASLMNLITAMGSIHLSHDSPLDYFREILWDDSLAQDRFFGYAAESLLNEVAVAAQQKMFEPEPHPGLFHKGATSSYKQVQYGEANVQLTFHEQDTKTIKGERCVLVEPDIDYFKDLGAHAIFEVIPNSITHGLTDPKLVYMLRWIASRHAGIADFNPPYTIE